VVAAIFNDRLPILRADKQFPMWMILETELLPAGGMSCMIFFCGDDVVNCEEIM